MGLRKLLKKTEKVARKASEIDLLGLGAEEGPANPYAAPDLSYLRSPVFYEEFTPDVLRTISALGLNQPSSVDAVTSRMEKEYRDTLLRDIDRDTGQNVAQGMSDYYSRGLFEPGAGVSSDIASIGLGQIRGQGQERATDARLKYSLADLGRLREQEDYINQLKGNLVSGAAGRKDRRDLGYAQTYADLYSSAEDRKQRGKKSGYLEDILRNTQINVG